MKKEEILSVNKEKEAAEMALNFLKKSGVDGARIVMGMGIVNSITAEKGDIESIMRSNDSSITAQIIINGRYGEYATNNLDHTELKDFLINAINNTKLIAPDNYRKLAPKELYWSGDGEDLEQLDIKYNTISPLKKREIAIELMDEVYNKESRVVSISTQYCDSLSYTYMIDSQGFNGESLISNYIASAECTVKGDGERRSRDAWFKTALHFNDFNYKGCGTIAMERAIKKLNPQKIESGKYNVVIENNVASKFILPLTSALNGYNIQQKNSFLEGKLGEQIFSKRLTLLDKPHIKGALSSRYFDNEGVATTERAIIKNGIVNTYFIDSYISNILNTPQTVDGYTNLVLSTEPFNEQERGLKRDDILKRVDRGIYITGFNGGNKNLLNGDFSFGIEGYYIENGELKYPIYESNITGNLVSLWNNLLYVGEDPNTNSFTKLPTIAFENVDINGY